MGALLGGRYRLDSRIAVGGMGEVWRGHDEVLGRSVALKIMHAQLSSDPGFVDRFRAEARNTARLHHPGIAAVYDYGETQLEGGPPQAYLVMQLVDGEPLSDLLARVGKLPVDTTLELVAQTAEALHAAHRAGVVHRDVKPANLMVQHDPATGANTVVVTDFGIARTVESTHITSSGQVFGTAAYLPPEQAAGKKATPASDQYSLGVVAYLCLSGRRPFTDENPTRVALAHLRDKPPALPSDIPPAARALVTRAMAKEPGSRYADMEALAGAARAAMSGVVTSSGKAPTPRIPKPGRGTIVPATPTMANAAALGTTIRQSRSHRRGSVLAIGIAAAVALVLMVGAGYAIAMNNRPQQVAQKTPADGGSNEFDQSPQGGATSGVPSPTPSPSQSTAAGQSQTPGAQTPGQTGGPSAPPSSPGRTTKPQPQPIVLDPGAYQGMSCPDARSAIEAKGLNTTRVDKDGTANAKPNTFLDVNPRQAYKGQTVTVTCTPVASTPPSPTPSASTS
ncbi:serine/threonine protein kinase [Fodinicola acaciae]|uniref:serine/threonine protein kinase n=1 Tax=Fodinicola acaciae TaxID=2681555 RepID=UPI0013CFD55C|nr:serine/threonine protein kinase [Fodinicola acaciae]